MRVVRAVPEPVEAVDLDGDALSGWLAAHYAPWTDRFVRVNLVNAIGGRIAGPSGGSGDLTGGVDRQILRLIRRTADVVLVGAGTVRASGEDYVVGGPAPIAVVSASGDIGQPRFAADAREHALLVLAPASARDRVLRATDGRAILVPVEAGSSPRELLEALAALGLHRVVCEGGGGLASRLIAAGLVDELCLTAAPVLVSPGPQLLVGDVPFREATLAGLLVDATGRTYSRFALSSSNAPSA